MKNIAVIYLDRNRFDCMMPHQTATVPYDFSPHTVKDFEPLNKDTLYNEMHTFITDHHMSPCSIIIILSNNVIFVKDLPENKSDQLLDAIALFLESIPFETIMHRTVKFDKKTKIVATNSMYLDLLKDVFEKNQCKVLLILPEFVFGDIISQKGLDTVASKKIIYMMNTLKQYDVSHMTYAQNIPHAHEQFSEIPEKKSYARLIVLLFVFILLTGILIVLFFISQKSSKKTIPKPSVTQNQFTPSPVFTSVPISEITLQSAEKLTPPAEIIIHTIKNSILSEHAV